MIDLLVEILREQGPRTSKELAEIVGVHDCHVRTWLAKEIFSSIGSGKTKRWTSRITCSKDDGRYRLGDATPLMKVPQS